MSTLQKETTTNMAMTIQEETKETAATNPNPQTTPLDPQLPPRELLNIPYRLLREGQGSTLHFDTSAPNWPNSPLVECDRSHLPWAGTYGCKTCVGLWFRIDTQRSFLAHLNAWMPMTRGPSRRTVSEAEGRKLAERVYARLMEHARREKYSGAGIERSSIVMVCPETREEVYPFKKLTGGWIIEAIRLFLNLRPPLAVRHSAHQGFLVNQATGARVKVAYDENEVYDYLAPKGLIEDFEEWKEFPGQSLIKGAWLFDLSDEGINIL